MLAGDRARGVGGLLLGCDGIGDAGVRLHGDPELETIGPDVQVVDDLDYPVFFSGGFYWLNDGGFWYRSHSWRGGWVGVAPVGVPLGIRGIRAPLAYSHWHGGYAHGVATFHGNVGRGGYRGAPSYQPHVVAHGYGGHGAELMAATAVTGSLNRVLDMTTEIGS